MVHISYTTTITKSSNCFLLFGFSYLSESCSSVRFGIVIVARGFGKFINDRREDLLAKFMEFNQARYLPSKP